ncbi:protein kinase domain-containing protein [Streptomyces sp. NBC_01803]|uniref:serine/threonine-protein kinase n=1 Tax=Streptomyces sp. NBC_01803 TaxID=2975946 RepID=UPI002DD9F164|nr:protein kinase [Streptomyces sp. NBC_01803]WSA45656.1 protein kinase [Streptomyces sp. NBC_01803]
MTEHRGTAGGGAPPERLGDYVLERRLGSGGMGVVYLARTVAGRQLAVKVIRREYAEDPGFRDRFRREVAAARRVSGAFTAPVVDADPEGDPPWLATLYVPGGSLTDRVQHEGPMTAREAARVGAQLAEALQDIHRCGLVHRDLKPGNVLLAKDGVRVIDFGISRALSDSHRLTERGAVLGSPPFMAPEQLTGESEVTTAADVFALGAVVAFAVTGHSPFEAGGLPGGDPLAVAYRVVHEEPDLGDLPDSLRDLVSLCLAKDPERRPEVSALLRMAEWADTRAQAAVIRASPVWRGGQAERRQDDTPARATPRARRRRRLMIGAAALAVAVAGFGGWLAGVSNTDADADGDMSAGTGPPRATPVEPWELALQDIGVRDAATEGFSCRPTTTYLLCSAGGALAVVLDRDGTELWRHTGPRDAIGGPSAFTTGGAVLVRSDKGVATFSEAGDELWEIDAPELTGELLRVRGTLVLQNGDSTLRFYSVDSPAQVGEWSTPGRYLTEAVSSGSYALVESRTEETGADPQLMLLDADGREAWTAPRRPPAEVTGYLETIGMDQEAAYFQELDADLPVVTAVVRLDLSDGTWTRTELSRSADPRGVVADGVVYASDTAGVITAVDAAAGEELWTAETGIGTASEPAVADGRLYLSDGEGRLYEVNAADGEVLRSGEVHAGTPGPGSDAWAPAPVIADGVAYVVTLGNTLYATPLDDLREP